MVYVILGAPGAGKGTRAEYICEKTGMVHISTGTLVRENKVVYEKYKERMNKGYLLSDDIINGLLEERLNRPDVSNGFILDGYPRTLEQAEKLNEFLDKINMKISKVLLIDADSEIIYDRILGRKICPKCEKIYNRVTAGEANNLCQVCGEGLVTRKDDNTDTLKNRIDAYYEHADEIIKYYDNLRLLERVDAVEKTEKILERVEK